MISNYRQLLLKPPLSAMQEVLRKSLLYFRTMRNLRAKQMMFFFVRRIIKKTYIPKVPAEMLCRSELTMQPSPCLYQYDIDKTFTFLNEKKLAPLDSIDWVAKDKSKLWRYNLHYFDYLLHESCSIESGLQLMLSWIDSNPLGSEDAWEPYTASLRIVNWVKFLVYNAESLADCYEIELSKITLSLYQQSQWLEQNIEYHILANHYLKNGVALFFAGTFFSDNNANRWHKKGLAILVSEIDEQFLSDGGHYERSPMYHILCVLDYLDVVNIASSEAGQVADTTLLKFKTKLLLALSFLQRVVLPDGEIALLNDSAIGIAPKPQQVFDYALQVLGFMSTPHSGGFEVSALAASGYYTARYQDDFLILDCGDIGPQYQPGHAHCDTLSYELAFNGKRLIVDTGVHDYNKSWCRDYSRSTAAHNTVSVDNAEQSEIWEQFRVARRATVFQASLMESQKHFEFVGGYTGFAALSDKIHHQRQIKYEKKGQLTVRDTIDGQGEHQINNYIRIHPDFTVEQVGESVILSEQGRAIAVIDILFAHHFTINEGWYFPEFGKMYKCQYIDIHVKAELPITTQYTINKILQ